MRSRIHLMHRSGQLKSSTQSNDEPPSRKAQTISTVQPVSLATLPHHGFDWLALGVVILIAAFFAFTARFNAHSASSFVPFEVLSVTARSFLITALGKLRIPQGLSLVLATLADF